jgi:hypothetical protein
MKSRRLDFRAVAVAALSALPALLQRWLPKGRRIGNEWVALNPTRADSNPGSFKVNLRTGRWADFATRPRKLGCAATQSGALGRRPQWGLDGGPAPHPAGAERQGGRQGQYER